MDRYDKFPNLAPSDFKISEWPQNSQGPNSLEVDYDKMKKNSPWYDSDSDDEEVIINAKKKIRSSVLTTVQKGTIGLQNIPSFKSLAVTPEQKFIQQHPASAKVDASHAKLREQIDKLTDQISPFKRGPASGSSGGTSMNTSFDYVEPTMLQTLFEANLTPDDSAKLKSKRVIIQPHKLSTSQTGQQTSG
jgi:hypothetical protein